MLTCIWFISPWASLQTKTRTRLDLDTDLLAVWKVKQQNNIWILNHKDYLLLLQALEAEVDAGRCRAIGLSNCNSEQIERIVRSARIKPANLQVELHAYFQPKPLREVCKKHGISVCAYSPLGSKGRIAVYTKSGLHLVRFIQSWSLSVVFFFLSVSLSSAGHPRFRRSSTMNWSRRK